METKVEDTKTRSDEVKKAYMGKFVRVVISDNREYSGKFQCIDKDKNIFLDNGFEVYDRKANPDYYEHDLFKNLIRNKADDMIYKYVGSVIIPGRHISSIKFEKDITQIYENKICAK